MHARMAAAHTWEQGDEGRRDEEGGKWEGTRKGKAGEDVQRRVGREVPS